VEQGPLSSGKRDEGVRYTGETKTITHTGGGAFEVDWATARSRLREEKCRKKDKFVRAKPANMFE